MRQTLKNTRRQTGQRSLVLYSLLPTMLGVTVLPLHCLKAGFLTLQTYGPLIWDFSPWDGNGCVWVATCARISTCMTRNLFLEERVRWDEGRNGPWIHWAFCFFQGRNEKSARTTVKIYFTSFRTRTGKLFLKILWGRTNEYELKRSSGHRNFNQHYSQIKISK